MIRIHIRKQLLTSEGTMDLEVELTIEKGQLVTLYGKSGIGKTTLLKIVAGLVQPDSGLIEVNGKTWLDTRRNINRSPQQREIGFVFQDYALFPNMTVRENLRVALRNSSNHGLVDRLLEMTGLTQLAARKPQTLSGGQQQRVALIRALAREPTILLLDEPLSSLDIEMRQALREEILTIHREFGTTTLLVSHDLAEIYRLSDEVVFIDKGKVQRIGTPDKLFGEDRLSNKIRLTGEVLQIRKNEVVNVVQVLVGNHVIRIIATDEELEGIRLGDPILIASKAFNPVVIRLDQQG